MQTVQLKFDGYASKRDCIVLLYLDDAFSKHDTGTHPECAARIVRLNDVLRQENWDADATCPQWTLANRQQLLAVHEAAYVDKLKQWCEQAAGRIEADTVVSKGSWDAALRGAGAAVDATRRVILGEDKTAFCAIRPPGHHAKPSGAMGFCLVNNIAIAAHAAIAAGLSRVMIVDWDVHHGNGTQDTFYDDGRVAFYSIHRSPFYPGTGSDSETGSGRGLGWICNSPVSAEITSKKFMDVFQAGVESLAAKVEPELILLSAGFDAHRADPVGSLCLEEEDFAQLTRRIKEIAGSYCEGRIVSMLEGGYHLDHMPTSVLAHVIELAR